MSQYVGRPASLALLQQEEILDHWHDCRREGDSIDQVSRHVSNDSRHFSFKQRDKFKQKRHNLRDTSSQRERWQIREEKKVRNCQKFKEINNPIILVGNVTQSRGNNDNHIIHIANFRLQIFDCANGNSLLLVAKVKSL